RGGTALPARRARYAHRRGRGVRAVRRARRARQPAVPARRRDLGRHELDRRVITPAAVDPRRADESAVPAGPAGDPALRVAALRALALAAKELGHLTEGLSHLDEALRIAEAEGLAYPAAQVRMNLVGLLTARGDIDAALAAADEAAPVLTGADADR